MLRMNSQTRIILVLFKVLVQIYHIFIPENSGMDDRALVNQIVFVFFELTFAFSDPLFSSLPTGFWLTETLDIQREVSTFSAVCKSALE